MSGGTSLKVGASEVARKTQAVTLTDPTTGEQTIISATVDTAALEASIGAPTDAAAAADDSNASLVSLFKRYLARFTTFMADTTPVPVESGVYFVSVTPTIDTAIYAAADSLFNSTVITSATRQADMGAVLQSVTVIDKDKEAAAISLVFFSFNVTTWGAANAAEALTDAESVYILGQVDIAAADYKAHANQSVATKTGLGISLIPASGTRNVYVAAYVTSGTPTYTAATDLLFRFGMLG